MADRYMHEYLTPSVLEAQENNYNRTYDTTTEAPAPDDLRPAEVEMIQSRDSFYMATITENAWPYVQHRGGPPGFLRTLGPREIGFADYRGNRQLISTGNLTKQSRVSLFLMDYPNRKRLKMIGHASVLDANEHPDLAHKLEPAGGHPAKPERLFVIEILSYDWNCPKFITPRYTAEEMEEIVDPLQLRIKELETELEKRG